MQVVCAADSRFTHPQREQRHGIPRKPGRILQLAFSEQLITGIRLNMTMAGQQAIVVMGQTVLRGDGARLHQQELSSAACCCGCCFNGRKLAGQIGEKIHQKSETGHTLQGQPNTRRTLATAHHWHGPGTHLHCA